MFLARRRCDNFGWDESRVRNLRRTRIPSRRLFNSVIPTHRSSIGMTAPTSRFSRSRHSHEPGLGGMLAGRDCAMGVEGAATSQAVATAFTALLHAGSKTRNPSLESGRERWALACGTALLLNLPTPGGLDFVPWAWILYSAATLRLPNPDSGNKYPPCFAVKRFPAQPQPELGRGAGLKGQPAVPGCSRATEPWMPSLSLLLARPLTENPAGTELGGGSSFSSQGTALFFLGHIFHVALCYFSVG